MNFEFSEEQHLLRDQARAFLAEFCPTDTVRAVLDSDNEWDPAGCGSVWRRWAGLPR